MIPRHRPPFSTSSLLASWLRSLRYRPDVTQLEQQWSHYLQVPHAIWIPSARYGIARTLQTAVPTRGHVFSSAFNCGAVHHALEVCGRSVRWQDCAPHSFLADCQGPAPNRSDHWGIVLSEMFGHRFSGTALDLPIVRDADVRVFDLAMCLPTPSDMQRIRSGDVAVFSFGLGKSLFAGGGGLAVTRCHQMAAEIRQRLAYDLTQTSRPQQLRSDARLLARTVAHERALYGRLRRRKNRQSSSPEHFSSTSAEWRRSATPWHLARCMDNLKKIEDWIRQRSERAVAFRTAFQKSADCGAGLALPPEAGHHGLSHYSIRVPAMLRDSVCRALMTSGVDVGRLFPLALQFAPRDFPHAAAAASEVINLPLGSSLSANIVDRIVQQIEDALGPATVATGLNPAQRLAA